MLVGKGVLVAGGVSVGVLVASGVVCSAMEGAPASGVIASS
jgi:hypothetical protein